MVSFGTFSIEDTIAIGTSEGHQQFNFTPSLPQNTPGEATIKFSAAETTIAEPEVTDLPIQSERGELSSQADKSKLRSIPALFEENKKYVSEADEMEMICPDTRNATIGASACSISLPDHNSSCTRECSGVPSPRRAVSFATSENGNRKCAGSSSSHRCRSMESSAQFNSVNGPWAPIYFQENEVARKISMREKTPFCRQRSDLNLSNEEDKLEIPRSYASPNSFVDFPNGEINTSSRNSNPAKKDSHRLTCSESAECTDEYDMSSTARGRYCTRNSTLRDQTPFNQRRLSLCTDDGEENTPESPKIKSSRNVPCSSDRDTTLASPGPYPRGPQRERRRASSSRTQTLFNVNRFSICSYEEDVKGNDGMKIEARDGDNKLSILRLTSNADSVDAGIENVESNYESPPMVKRLSSVQFAEDVEIIGNEVMNRKSPRQSRGMQNRSREGFVSQSIEVQEAQLINGDGTLGGKSRARTSLAKRSATLYIPRRMTSDESDQVEQEKSTSTDPEDTNSISFSRRKSASANQSTPGIANSSGQLEGKNKVNIGSQTPFASSTCCCRCRCIVTGGQGVGVQIRHGGAEEGKIFEWKPLLIWAVANIVGAKLMNYAVENT